MISTLLLLSLSAAPGDAVLARVDGTPVTVAMVSRQSQRLAAAGRPVSASQALDSCVDDVLLAAEARRRGLENDPRKAAYVATARRAACFELQAARDFTPAAATDAELREMFHAIEDSCTYEQLAFEKAETAKAARARIDGGTPFADEARSAVVSRIFPNPQTAPVTLRSQMHAALATALFAAPPKTVVGPVQTETGWVVARTLAVRIGTEEQFAARRQSLADRRLRETRKASERHVAEGLRKKNGVTVDEKFLRGLGGEPTPKQLEQVIAKVGDRQLRYGDIYPVVQETARTFQHLAGPGYRISLAWTAVDRMLLEDLALSSYGKAPEVVARADEFERAALAQVAVDQIVAKVPAEKRQEALAREFEKLRKASKITVDGAALAQAFPPNP
jgi:hypothetical protein